MVVAKQKQNLVDKIASRVRELLNEIDRLITPQPTQRPVPVPVRIPVRPERRMRNEYPYR